MGWGSGRRRPTCVGEPRRTPVRAAPWEGTLNELDRTWARRGDEGQAHHAGATAFGLSEIDLAGTIRSIFAGFWRQRYVVGSVLCVFVLAGLVYAFAAPPRYTARAAILIDPRLPNNPTDSATSSPVLLLSDQLVVDSEVRVLTSPDLIAAAAAKLRADGVVATPPTPGPVAELLAPVVGPLGEALQAARDAVLGPPDPRDAETDFEEMIARNLTVERSGETYVIDLSFEAYGPEFAARVANEIVDQYFLIQARDSLDDIRRLSTWLSDRVADLAEEVAVADGAVESYRQENKLYDVGTEAAMLPVRVELRSANDELITTRNEIGELTTQIGSVREALAAGELNVGVQESGTQGAALDGLRTDLVKAVDRERELAQQLGANHELTRSARTAVERTRGLIRDELGNVVDRLSARRGALETQAQALSTRIGALEGTASADERRSITLRNLEREATAKRQLYESLLEKQNETAQRESFTPSPGRIVARAVVPDEKSAPNRKLVLALAIFGGLVLGSGVAFLREELNDTYLRDVDVIDGLRLPLIGVAPLVRDDILRMRKAGVRVRLPKKKLFAPRQRWHGFAADFSRSMLAETLRALDAKVADKGVEPHGDNSVVLGMTSARKGEGKSMLSLNFAAMKAQRGYRVALLDLDVRARGASSVVRAVPAPNVLDTLIAEGGRIDRLLPSEQLFGTYLIGPSGRSSIVMSDPNVRRELAALVDDLRHAFDYVVVDLPPLTGLIDADVAAELTDFMVLVIEWGQTRQDHLERLLSVNTRVRERLVGAIFNKVHLGRYSSYNGSSVHDYYAY